MKCMNDATDADGDGDGDAADAAEAEAPVEGSTAEGRGQKPQPPPLRGAMDRIEGVGNWSKDDAADGAGDDGK